MDFAWLRCRAFVRLLGVALLLCAAVARAEEPVWPAVDGDADAPVEPWQEEPPDWLPNGTVPHPYAWEQLWRPGDLVSDSYWLRRPWSAGFFAGTMDGDDPASGLSAATDWFGGLRFGNDFAPTWGWEVRSAFFSPGLGYEDPAVSDIAHEWFVDLNVLHYPWGDTRWRPYWSIGLGGGQFEFMNAEQLSIREWVVDMPLAIGCKWHVNRWLVLRGELGDTLVFGNENVDFLSQLHLNVGAEVHWHAFKTRPVKYGY